MGLSVVVRPQMFFTISPIFLWVIIFKFDIYKVYCSGKVSGHYWDRFDTNESGEWFSGMRYEYDYANSQDEVVIEFTIANPGGPDHVEVEKFRYSEVENNDDEIFFTSNIRLPWQAPWE